MSQASTLTSRLQHYLLPATDEASKKKEAERDEVVSVMVEEGLLGLLIHCLGLLEFDANRDIMHIFNIVLHRKVKGRLIAVKWLAAHESIFSVLFEKYDDLADSERRRDIERAEK